MASLRFVALCTAAVLTAQPALSETVLHILHVNDLHSRIEPVNAYNGTCSEEAAGETCFGGVARLHTAVTEARDAIEAAGEPVLVLDAGDQFQGSLFFSTYSGQAEAEFMNAIGFDAMALGNHEFDIGTEPLAKFVAAVDFPVLFGNVTVEDGRLAQLDRGGPVILDAGGERVGLVGATTPRTAEISSPGPTVTFGDVTAHVREAIAELQAEGVDKIIALTHQGVAADIRLAETVAGLDAIIGGHSHTLFSNTAENASFPYPYFVTDPEGREVPIVSAGSYSKYLGHLVLTFDDAGEVVEATGDTRLLDASVAPDERIAARVRALGAPIEELKKQVLAEVPQRIDGSPKTCWVQECAMGNLVADAMLDRVRDQGVTIAIHNSGGLRASFQAGKVRKADVLAVLPFQNTLATFNLTGEAIVAALENGVSRVEEAEGRFPQVAGLRFAWDPETPPMAGRVRDVTVRQGDAWVPIDPNETYAVVSNNFLRGGGDGYAVFRDQGRNAYDFGPNLEEVVAEFLAAHPDYLPATEGRITRLE